MLDSENLKTFNKSRKVFKPYGLTCELWKPDLMTKPDRHNEIELNFCSENTITYLLKDKKITIPAKRLTAFWGLVPHQIVDFKGVSPYYVCTIPFSEFFSWKLPPQFVDRLLKGDVIYEVSDESSSCDEFLLNRWINDIIDPTKSELILLEIKARLYRLAFNIQSDANENTSTVDNNAKSQVERIAIFIAQNYGESIKVNDIGDAVDLHPDYANAIFKKAFGKTLTEYLTEERISNTQRLLVSTDKTITEIAFECGFNSISRFNAVFQKMNQCTPREFRKKYQGN
jgi:AraC-like DNA-binding protein